MTEINKQRNRREATSNKLTKAAAGRCSEAQTLNNINNKTNVIKLSANSEEIKIR